ncbi:hypothetical protein SteCoe_3282 [Stentor coeruleus]|uniref:Translin-associated factor X-interacting protein 1 N-terminal domain-containing protein n=1 Tax=Stentor coeruleus TaxID=5963 RepID=A0A1R2CXI7_9CILI|nr:hypothetical protein SteCoe_3282 [Stentor coeruleus]
MKKLDLDGKNRGRPKNSKDSGKSSKNLVPSPYSKPVIKPRSASNSKSTTNIKQPSTLLFNSNKNLFQESTPIDKNPILKASLSEARFDISEDDFDKRLLKDLKTIRNPDDEFDMYQKFFTEVIKADKKYGRILAKIKAGYDLKILSSENSIVTKLKNEIKEFQNQLSKEHKDRQLYVKKLEKLAKENVELSRLLDDAEIKYNTLVGRIKDITQYDVGKLPKDEMTWKALNYENQSLVKINKELQVDLKTISTKEKKLVGLLVEMKKQGYPVEQIYEKQISKSKRDISPGSYVEDTDNEDLVSGRAKEVAKPAIIPKLNLGDIQVDGLSNDSYLSDI